jgi:hypothetical protein
MEGLQAPIQALGKVGHFRDLSRGNVAVPQAREGSPRGDDLVPQIDEPTAEVHHARLVRNTNNRSFQDPPPPATPGSKRETTN